MWAQVKVAEQQEVQGNLQSINQMNGVNQNAQKPNGGRGRGQMSKDELKK